MTLPPGSPDDDPDGPGAADGLHEVIQHPAAREVGKMIDKALEWPPSAGQLGRMELLRHWDGLSAAKRKALLLVAREMSQGERG
jgi:hypothetical protein